MPVSTLVDPVVAAEDEPMVEKQTKILSIGRSGSSPGGSSGRLKGRWKSASRARCVLEGGLVEVMADAKVVLWAKSLFVCLDLQGLRMTSRAGAGLKCVLGQILCTPSERGFLRTSQFGFSYKGTVAFLLSAGVLLLLPFCRLAAVEWRRRSALKAKGGGRGERKRVNSVPNSETSEKIIIMTFMSRSKSVYFFPCMFRKWTMQRCSKIRDVLERAQLSPILRPEILPSD